MILCYHGVSDTWEHPLAVRPRVFERQLRTLLFRRYRPVSVVEIVQSRAWKDLHVTFDDAYRNVASALPVLEQLRIPATVFACAAYAIDGRPLDVPNLAAEAAAHPEQLATMTWEELRAIAERGIEIGSHTLTHPRLPTLTDAELGRELRDSRSLIEDELGRPCRYLAYPWGAHDERVRHATRQAGYEAAFALRPFPREHQRYALPRIDLYRKDHSLRAALKTSLVRPIGLNVNLLRSARRRGST